jgi:uncharacterized protein (DUF2141 family)
MNRFSASLLFFICFTLPSFSQFKLEVEITGIKNTKGNLMIQLLDSTQVAVKQEMSAIADSACTISFSDLAPGQYAIRYYHDENLNGKMDTNFVGKPTEGYGFSNNVIGKMGPPPFEKWLFEVKEDLKIFLKATY